jgi:hypothetical protein
LDVEANLLFRPVRTEEEGEDRLENRMDVSAIREKVLDDRQTLLLHHELQNWLSPLRCNVEDLYAQLFEELEQLH